MPDSTPLPRRPRGHPRVTAVDSRRIPSGKFDLAMYEKCLAIGGGKFMKGLRIAVDAYQMNGNTQDRQTEIQKEESNVVSTL